MSAIIDSYFAKQYQIPVSIYKLYIYKLYLAKIIDN